MFMSESSSDMALQITEMYQGNVQYIEVATYLHTAFLPTQFALGAGALFGVL